MNANKLLVLLDLSQRNHIGLSGAVFNYFNFLAEFLASNDNFSKTLF